MASCLFFLSTCSYEPTIICINVNELGNLHNRFRCIIILSSLLLGMYFSFRRVWMKCVSTIIHNYYCYFTFRSSPCTIEKWLACDECRFSKWSATIIIANGTTLYEEKKRKETEKKSGTSRLIVSTIPDVYRADYEFDTLENLWRSVLVL
jgi:hypothetical protein